MVNTPLEGQALATSESTPFDSSLLKEGEYTRTTLALRLTFHNGTTREFRGIEPAMWEELKLAASPGRYFNQCIRPFYTAYVVGTLSVEWPSHG